MQTRLMEHGRSRRGRNSAEGMEGWRDGGREGGRGVVESRARGQHHSKTHLSATGPPTPVLADRRRTLRKKLRLYCVSKRLHQAVKVCTAVKGGQPLNATSHRGTVYSPIIPIWCKERVWRGDAFQAHGSREIQEGGSRAGRGREGAWVSRVQEEAAAAQQYSGTGLGSPTSHHPQKTKALYEKLRLYCMPDILHRVIGPSEGAM